MDQDFDPGFSGLDRLLELYDEIDSEIEAFKSATGLGCIPNCGKCCSSPKVIESTVLEAIPLSIQLWKEEEAESCLRKIQTADPENPCVLYDPDRSRNGRCIAYQWRPAVCRLFGFSAILNKKGKPVIALCRVLKAKNPGLNDRIQGLIDRGVKVPVYSFYGERFSFLDPFLAITRYPINEALRMALEAVGLRKSIIGAEEISLG